MTAAEPGDPGAGDLLASLIRWRVGLVAATLAATSGRHVMSGEGDWTVFGNASELLFGVKRPWFHLPGGLHTYANYPEYQVGPLSVLFATPFRMGGDNGRRVMIVVLLLMVVAMYGAIDRLVTRGDRTRQLGSLAAGLLLAVGWVPLAANYVHPDDALALAALVAAVVATTRGRTVTAGVLVGLAVASKPWGVLFAPLLLAAPSRDRTVRGVLAMVAVASAAWLPFVLGDLGTLKAAAPQVDVDTSSVLHLFGVPFGTGPDWVRTAQLGIGLGMGTVLALRGRWIAVPMVALAVRVLLDPGVFSYYTSGLLVVTVIWDLLGSRWRVPWATIVAFIGLNAAEVAVDSASARGVLRLVVCVTLIVGGVAATRPADVDAPADLPPVPESAVA